VGAGAASSGRPRARRRFDPGGVRPSSEAEIRPRGRPALELGGDSLEGASDTRARQRSRGAAPGPRARRKSARGVPRLAARWDAEVIWAVGSSLHQVVITWGVIYSLWVHLRFIVLRNMGFSPVIRGPSWRSPTLFKP
jgi:hypothetical protein